MTQKNANEPLEANSDEIIVSIACFTYNHAKYIEQTIEGFLSQKTNFKIEIIFHDDASTDSTADIIRGYEKQYPDLFKCVYQKENQYAKCPNSIVKFAFDRVAGKYVAMCEGDDFWTDPLKLQKQVDFLESHPDYFLSFHAVDIMWDGIKTPDPEVIRPPESRPTYTQNDLLRKYNFIPTCSVVFRTWPDFSLFPEWFYRGTVGDVYLFFLIAGKGKMGYFDQCMATYRKHPGGVSNAYVRDEDMEKDYLEYYRLLDSEYQLSKNRKKDFFIGLSNWYVMLAWAFLLRGALLRAILASSKAVYYSIPFNFFGLIRFIFSKIVKQIMERVSLKGR